MGRAWIVSVETFLVEYWHIWYNRLKNNPSEKYMDGHSHTLLPYALVSTANFETSNARVEYRYNLSQWVKAEVRNIHESDRGIKCSIRPVCNCYLATSIPPCKALTGFSTRLMHDEKDLFSYYLQNFTYTWEKKFNHTMRLVLHKKSNQSWKFFLNLSMEVLCRKSTQLVSVRDIKNRPPS